MHALSQSITCATEQPEVTFAPTHLLAKLSACFGVCVCVCVCVCVGGGAIKK